MNGPCLTATLDHLPLLNNSTSITLFYTSWAIWRWHRNIHRGKNYKFSIGFPRLPHKVSSSLSPATSIYYEKMIMPYNYKFHFYKVQRYPFEAGEFYSHTWQLEKQFHDKNKQNIAYAYAVALHIIMQEHMSFLAFLKHSLLNTTKHSISPSLGCLHAYVVNL